MILLYISKGSAYKELAWVYNVVAVLLPVFADCLYSPICIFSSKKEKVSVAVKTIVLIIYFFYSVFNKWLADWRKCCRLGIR